MMLTYPPFMQRPTFTTALGAAVPPAFPHQLPVLGSHLSVGPASHSSLAFHAQLRPGSALTTPAAMEREQPKSPEEEKPSEAEKPSSLGSFSIASILGRDDKPKPPANVAAAAAKTNVHNPAHYVDARSPTTPLSAGHRPSGLYYFYPTPQAASHFPFAAAQHPGCLEAEIQRRMAAPVAVIGEIVRSAGTREAPAAHRPCS